MQFKVTRRKMLAGSASLLLATVPSRADWRTDLGTFRIGVLESEAAKLSPSELERIRTAYADVLKLPADINRARDLPALVDALISGRVDYAILSAAAFASASLVCSCVEPVARPVMDDGSLGTRAVLFMAADLALADMVKSRGIAIIGPDAFNSYGAAMAGLPALEPAFKPGAAWIREAGSIEAAAALYISGAVDGFIVPVPERLDFGRELAGEDYLAGLLARSPRIPKAVWRSDIIANGPHTVRQNLSAEAKTLLSGFLENLVYSDPDLNDILLPEGAVSFAKVNAGAYASAINAAKALAASSGSAAP